MTTTTVTVNKNLIRVYPDPSDPLCTIDLSHGEIKYGEIAVPEISWPSLGSVSLQDAEDFANAILQLVEVGRGLIPELLPTDDPIGDENL